MAPATEREHDVRRSRTSVSGRSRRTFSPDVCLTTTAKNLLGATQRETRNSKVQFGTFPPEAGAETIIAAVAATAARAIANVMRTGLR